MTALKRTALAGVLWFGLAGGWPPAAGQGQGKEITVWAIEASKVYHCPGSRWYGSGAGKKMGECQAIREKYKPAFGLGCGSRCQPK